MLDQGNEVEAGGNQGLLRNGRCRYKSLLRHSRVDRSLVPYDVLVEEWPLDEYEDQHDEFLDECCPVDHLFGYTDSTSLAYDPTPEGTIPFLTLTSLDELEWCWNDGDYLQMFISREAVASGDFNNISSDAG